jgi:hypothetical protein
VQVPRPGSRRGDELAGQRVYQRRGLFRDRLIVFPFTTIAGGTTQTQKLTITSMGSIGGVAGGGPSYVRLLALRGTVVDGVDVTPDLIPILLGQLRLRLTLNAAQDFVGGNPPDNTASFASLFSIRAAPWFFFDSPPRCRAGDTLQASIRNELEGDGSAMRPEFSIRVMDDALWTKLYLEAEF